MTKSDNIPRALSRNIGFDHAAAVGRFLTRALFVSLPETWDIVRGRVRDGPGGIRTLMGSGPRNVRQGHALAKGTVKSAVDAWPALE